MKHLNLRLSDTFMKFCEKIEYVESIARGDFYMKESGYFRKIEDTFRGDYYDGRVPVRWKADKVPVRLSNGEICEFEGINEDVYGIANDSEMPMFCVTVLDGCIVDEPMDGNICIFAESLFKKCPNLASMSYVFLLMNSLIKYCHMLLNTICNIDIRKCRILIFSMHIHHYILNHLEPIFHGSARMPCFVRITTIDGKMNGGLYC